jgi:hypothetical protein
VKWGDFTADHLIKGTLVTVNRAKISQLESYIVTIGWRDEARNKLVVLQKAEASFASTRLVASEHVHPVLWEKAVAIKTAAKK